MRLGNDPLDPWGQYVLGRQCAAVEGFNLHARTRIAANDREGLERLIRYIARPPLSEDRLSELADGRVAVRLKRPWRDGTTHVAFTPEEFIEKLVALVPRPRANLVRSTTACSRPRRQIAGALCPEGRSENPTAARGRTAVVRTQLAGARPRPRRWLTFHSDPFALDILPVPTIIGRRYVCDVGEGNHAQT